MTQLIAKILEIVVRHDRPVTMYFLTTDPRLSYFNDRIPTVVFRRTGSRRDSFVYFEAVVNTFRDRVGISSEIIDDIRAGRRNATEIATSFLDAAHLSAFMSFLPGSDIIILTEPGQSGREFVHLIDISEAGFAVGFVTVDGRRTTAIDAALAGMFVRRNSQDVIPFHRLVNPAAYFDVAGILAAASSSVSFPSILQFGGQPPTLGGSSSVSFPSILQFELQPAHVSRSAFGEGSIRTGHSFSFDSRHFTGTGSNLRVKNGIMQTELEDTADSGAGKNDPLLYFHTSRANTSGKRQNTGRDPTKLMAPRSSVYRLPGQRHPVLGDPDAPEVRYQVGHQDLRKVERAAVAAELARRKRRKRS